MRFTDFVADLKNKTFKFLKGVDMETQIIMNFDHMIENLKLQKCGTPRLRGQTDFNDNEYNIHDQNISLHILRG